MSCKGVCLVVAIAALAATAMLPRQGLALTRNGQQMMNNWAQANRCAAQAQKQFPDYTPDSLAKRDQALQRCLADSVLAPRTPQALGQPDHQ